RTVPDFLRVFRWPQFRNSGTSVCGTHALGNNPGGEFLNAMELVFTEQPAATDLRQRLARGGYVQYRVRQTLQEQDWQFANGAWSLATSQPAGTVDDPDPALQCWSPPEMRTLDTPGWSVYQAVGPWTRQFGFGGGVRSDPNALVVWVQQNFYTWLEGERVFTGGWDVVSVRYPWHNSLRLERATPTSDWASSPLTHIQSGHMEFGPNPRTATT
ncbi:MAG TPA: hypothetical protein VJT67_10415, partial [Longimicrobiaceae bacterium]|nr:hypothetical protein [Longimicrobiaceae bacterium]